MVRKKKSVIGAIMAAVLLVGATTQDFKTFVKAGRKLADLHLNYESIEPHPSVIIENDSDAPTVQQMRFGKSNGEEDKSIIHFNDTTRIINIPLRAYDWQVNGKSPIEWVMERCRIRRPVGMESLPGN